MSTFQEKVIKYRKDLTLSQKELAKKSGVGLRSIVAYENGKYFPQATQLYKLAKALEVSVEYLKNDDMDDSLYELDRMEYLKKMHTKTPDPEEMLKQNQAVFADDTISIEVKDTYFLAIMKAYLDHKEAAIQNLCKQISSDI